MSQVKSKQRVAAHGEVFTNEREVNAMLDLVWENFITVDKKISATYLEPACGSGILKHYPKKYKEARSFLQMEKALRYILSQNIICGNALDYNTSEGLTVEDFTLLEKIGVFNGKLMNDAVFKFKRYEDSSLNYTGIDKHKGEKIGGYNTIIEEQTS